MFWTVFFAVLFAMLVFEFLSDVVVLSRWNPLVYAAALAMFPFIWLSELHLPKSQRTRLF